MRSQTYGYRKASPPTGWYQIILLGDRGTCVLTTCTAERPGFEPATCWSQVRRPNHSATEPVTVKSFTTNAEKTWLCQPFGCAILQGSPKPCSHRTVDRNSQLNTYKPLFPCWIMTPMLVSVTYTQLVMNRCYNNWSSQNHSFVVKTLLVGWREGKLQWITQH